MTRSTLILFLTVLAGSGSAATRADYSQLPILFKPQAAAGAYAAQGSRFSLGLQPNSAQIALGRAGHRLAITVDFAGSNRQAELIPLAPQKAVASEFLGNDPSRWRRGLPTYAQVKAKNLYRGVDLVYYGNQERLEYDFLVAPGTDPRQIRMRFGGKVRLAVNRAGDLVLHSAEGDLIEKRPEVYQVAAGVRQPVSGRFALHPGNEVSFQLGAYDRDRPLVIDPQITYSSFLGGSGEEQGLAVAVDNSGNAYVAGYTATTRHGDNDVLVASFNPAGNTFNYIVQAGNSSFGFGGSNDDLANGIAVDGAGNAYVVGRTASDDFPVSSNAFQSTRKGGTDAFVLKLDPQGKNLLYSTFLGGGSDDQAWGVAVDSVGSAYVTGDTLSDSFPVTSGVYQANRAGGRDGFLAKFDTNGNRVFSTFFGGQGDDQAFAIALDAFGNSYITGNTHSDDFPVSINAYQKKRAGGNDAFVIKLDAAGANAIFSTYLGGTSDENSLAIALDAATDVYVVGATASSDFPTGQGAYQKVYQGGTSDIFVTELTPDGHSLVYSTFLGSHGTDRANGLAVDSAGNAIVVGDTDSDAYPVTGDALQNRRSGGLDGLITKLNSAGTGLIYSSFIGGKGDDSAQAVTLDAAGNAYVTGYTQSSNFPVASGAAQNTAGGGASDAFLMKYVFAPVLPAVNVNGVVNGATFTGGAAVSPGSIISIFGSSFTKLPVSATDTPLPTNLGGVTVTINGVAAPLYYVSANQINAQVPYEVQPGVANVVVNGLAGASSMTAVNVAAASPGLFLSGGRAIVQNADGTLNSKSNPAHAGSVVVVYLTGIGTLNPPAATGTAAGSLVLSRAALPYSASINGQPAMVQYLGVTPGFVGLDQANILIPPGVSGDVPLYITVGGIASNSATIAVAP